MWLRDRHSLAITFLSNHFYLVHLLFLRGSECLGTRAGTSHFEAMRSHPQARKAGLTEWGAAAAVPVKVGTVCLGQHESRSQPQPGTISKAIIFRPPLAPTLGWRPADPEPAGQERPGWRRPAWPRTPAGADSGPQAPPPGPS